MSKYDRLVRKVELFERLAVYGNRKSFLQALAEGQSIEPEPVTGNIGPIYDPSLNPKSNVVTIPEVTINGHIPVDPHIQNMLNDLVNSGLNPDGDLGPLTRAALKAFTQKFNLPATAKNIRRMHDHVSAKPIDLGPANQKPAPTGSELHLSPDGPMKPGTTSKPLGGIGITHRT